MASRRVEKLKLQGGSGVASGSGSSGNIQLGNVQINTSVDDTQKSIDELINAGLAGARSHDQNRNHFQRKKMPLSFFNPRMGTSAGGKSRGSSAGHSREGSSDDGGGRHTLSPTASAFCASTGTPLFGGGVPDAQMPVHQRQASAPALINYNVADQSQPQSHQILFVSSNRPRPMAGGGAAALPPVAHFHSKSLNTVTMHTPHMAPSTTGSATVGHIPFVGVGSAVGGSSLVLQRDVLFVGDATDKAPLPPIAHQRSVKSCDFDAVGISATGGFHQGFGGGGAMDASSQMMTTSYGDAYHSGSYMGHPAASYQHIHQPQHPMFSSQHAMPEASGISQGGVPFHTAHHHRTVTETATGDLAASVEFHADKPQHLENVYWMNPRGKSQSLDPISLTAAAEGASPLAPGASPITAPGSMASVNSATSNSQQQQQQFLLQQQQQSLGIASCSGNSMDDGLGPLPDGWAMSYDQKGDPYFIDHFNKTTTWYDPRISKEAQEETIKMRHSFLQKNNNAGGTITGNNNNNNGGVIAEELKQSPRPPATSPQQQQMLSPQQQQMLSPQQQSQGFDGLVQQPQTFQPQHGGSPGEAMDRIRQLKIERNYMLERRQQLCREGLLDRAATSQQQQQQTPPLMPQGQPAAFFQPTGQTLTYEAMPAGNLNDSTMEVDFQQGPAVPLHNLDPSALVPEFSASDLNPHEFDKYLQITENNRQFGVMR